MCPLVRPGFRASCLKLPLQWFSHLLLYKILATTEVEKSNNKKRQFLTF